MHNAISLFNRNDIKWSVNSVLTSINIDEYMNTRAYYKSKGAQAVAPTIVDSVALSDISLVPSLVQVESYYDKANHQKREAIDCGIMNTPINMNYGCGAGIGELAIAPDGGVYPCRMLMSKEWRCGDLVKQTFEDIWKNSETLVSMRRYLSNIGSVCSGCRVQRYCKGGCIAHSNSSPHNYISGEGGYFCHLSKYEIPMDMELNCYIREMKMNADLIKDMV